MQDTACGKDCPFVKTGFCESDAQCPNYCESVWVEAQSQEKKIVRDCVPKRLLFQNNDQNHRILALQEALEQQRNMFQIMSSNFKALFQEVEKLTIEQRKANLLLCPSKEQKLLSQEDNDE